MVSNNASKIDSLPNAEQNICEYFTVSLVKKYAANQVFE